MNRLLGPLLVFQRLDLECRTLKRELEQLPKEVSQLQNAIQTVQNAQKERKDVLKQLEVSRKEADLSLKSAEAKLLQLRVRQSEVKKNEEYQALNQEIEAQKQKISDAEDTELALLDQIESATALFEASQAEDATRIELLGSQIKHVEDKIALCQTHLTEAEASLQEAHKHVDPVWVKKYDQIARGLQYKGLAVVPLREERCCGCHLKVSNQVLGEVKKADGTKIPQCDNCSRILYVEAELEL